MYFYHVNGDVSVLSIYDGTVGLESFGTRLGHINLPTYRLKKEWINVAIKLDCIKHELTIHVVLANCQNFVEGVLQLMSLLR